MEKDKTNNRVIYLAIPYSHTNSYVVYLRSEIVLRAHAEFIKEGHIIFSPITQSHILAERFELPKDFEFWSRIDFAILDKADELWVIAIEGWETSRGVQAEIERARSNKIPIHFVKPQDLKDSENHLLCIYHDGIIRKKNNEDYIPCILSKGILRDTDDPTQEV